MRFESLQYLPRHLRNTMHELPVRRISAIAFPKEPHRDGSFANPWCLHLQTDSDRLWDGGVLIEMSHCLWKPSTVLRGGSKGSMTVSELDRMSSVEDELVKFVSVEAPEGLSVGDVVGALVETRWHKYEFDANGGGSRFWVTGCLSLFQRLSWGAAADYEAAKSAILKLWPEGTDSPLDQGAFYN